MEPIRVTVTTCVNVSLVSNELKFDWSTLAHTVADNKRWNTLTT